MEESKSQSENILWPQVWGLALLQFAVGLSWQIYGASQLVVLTRFDLVAAAAPLALVPGLLSLSLDPLFGKFSDQIRQRLGSRLPALNVGVLLTSLIFLTVAFALQTDWLFSFRWLIPVLMVFWVTAMKIFQNPSVALVKQYVPPYDLPQAGAILTVVAVFTGAVRPFARRLVAQYGVSLTFGLGGLVLLTALTVLHRLKPKATRTAAADDSPRLSRRQLLLIFGAGAGVQLAIGTLFAVLPARVQAYLPQVSIEVISSCMLIVSGLAALPLGEWIKRIGVERPMWIGLAGAVLVAGLAGVNGGAVLALGLLIVGGLVLAILYNIAIPFALARAPSTQTSLAIGLFFGGGGIALTFFAAYRVIYDTVPIALAAPLTLLALGVAGACSRGIRPRVPTNSV